MTTTYQNGAAPQTGELVHELYGGEIYEYYPLGKYIVRAQGFAAGDQRLSIHVWSQVCS